MPYKPKSKVQPYQKIRPLKEEPIAISLFNRSRKSKLPLFGESREKILSKLLQRDLSSLQKEQITVFKKGPQAIPAYPTTAPITTLLDIPYFKNAKALRMLYKDNKKPITSSALSENDKLIKKTERLISYLSEMGINTLGGLQSVLDNPSQRTKLMEKIKKEFPEFTLPLTKLATDSPIALYSLDALATADVYDALGYGPSYFSGLLKDLVMGPPNINSDGSLSRGNLPAPLNVLLQIDTKDAPFIAVAGQYQIPLPFISVNKTVIPDVLTALAESKDKKISKALDSLSNAINGYLKTPLLAYLPQLVDDPALLHSASKLHTLFDFLKITPTSAEISPEGKHFLRSLANSKDEYLQTWSKWAEKLLNSYSILYGGDLIERRPLEAIGLKNMGTITLEATPKGIAPGTYTMTLDSRPRVPELTLTTGNTTHVLQLPALIRQYSTALSNAYNKLYHKNKTSIPPQKQANPNQNRNYPQQRPQQKNNRGIEDIYKLLERNEKSQQQGYSGGYFRPR